MCWMQFATIEASKVIFILAMEISLAAETVFHIGSFPVTNSILTAWVVIIVLVVLGLLTRRARLIPKGVQNIAEYTIESLYNLVKNIIPNERIARGLFPLLGVFFVYILLGSWIGLLPGVGSFGLWEMKNGHEVLVPLFRAPMADLNTAIALALISITVTTAVGVAIIGPIEYTKKFLRLSSPLDFAVGILEAISEASRLISFSFRLFGNIFAGEVLISVMTYLIPYVLPMPFYAFELFVGFIQAFVFTALTTVFVSLAMQKHEHDSNDHSSKVKAVHG